MIKTIILAYDFPPYVSVGGLRPFSWYKYLYKFDIYPIVITRQWDNKHGNYLDYISPGQSDKTIIEKTEQCTIVRAPYKPNSANRLMLKYGEKRFKFIRRTISAYYEFAQWILNIGPKKNLYFAAKEYLRNNKVDLIIATGEPFVLFKYASKLSKIYNIPWIADYRDPWTQNKSNSKNFILRAWNSILEKKYLKNVSCITTVSEFFVEHISSLIKDKAFRIVSNGYDDDIITGIQDVKQNDKSLLNIGFVGTINKWHPLASFIKVISEFVNDNPGARINVNFYGINISDELDNLVKLKYSNIINKIKIYDRIPNEELLQHLAGNNLLLLFNYYSITGTKIYDYLAVDRKILLCYENDSEAMVLKTKYYTIDDIDQISCSAQADIIRETNAGYVVKDKEQLLFLLNKLYEEFENKGFIKSNTKGIEKYSRKYQTEVLSGLIKDTIKKNN